MSAKHDGCRPRAWQVRKLLAKLGIEASREDVAELIAKGDKGEPSQLSQAAGAA